MVRKAELKDPSGTINLSLWESHIQQIEDKQFYTVTNCKIMQYFGKHLAPKVNIVVTKAKEQDISNVTEQTKLGVLSRNHECLSNHVSSVQQRLLQKKKLVEILGQTLFVVYIATEQCL